MKVHHLKTESAYFKAVAEGRKPYEIRKNDRYYQEGDVVILNEWERETDMQDGAYTGRSLSAKVGFIMHATGGNGIDRFGISQGFSLFALADIELCPKQGEN